jgi:diguanylate cyclase (GGDEF)-like protein
VRAEGDLLVSYTPFNDLAGKPLAALRLSVPRGIEQAGDRMVWFTSFTLLTGALITLGAILLAVRATVIRPIARLASYFTSEAEGGEAILQASARRTDEIGVLAVQAGALIERIREQNAELENQANTDRLTGLANRHFLETHINKELRRIGRHLRGNTMGGLMAVVLIDVDHFKLFNDTNGHMAGDACLRALAEAIQGCIFRPGDLACRFGGEEFILVLPETDEAGALVVAESVRTSIERMALPHATSRVASVVTVSVGAAASEVGEGFKIEHLIELADQALYAAKQQGRNRVVAHSSLS